EEAFDLVQIPRVVPQDVPTRTVPTSVHVQRGGGPLVVVRKPNSGRSDALNVGVNVARNPLVCFVDADSILDPEALLSVSKPFADDPERVVASGGVVRAVNGCRVAAGRVVDVRMPTGWLARIQVVEYLRAFLLGRTGWSKMRTLMLISGAFGLFRRQLIVEVGGLDADCIGEDMELVVRMHRHLRRQRRPYRVVFVAEPVAWTEVPVTFADLGRQRRRWSRGLTQVLWKHRGMLANPRYGTIGLLGLPYYVLFELIAPFVELFGVVFVALGLALQVMNLWFAALFLLAAFGYALLLSLAALAVEEFSFHRYNRWRDLVAVAAAAVVENLGYRQVTAVWRIQGVWAALTRKQAVWGVMTRSGFGPEGAALP
ncbi:MAG: glycosyltransferase family 2 protein, partial [Actinomycetes bacterium]